MVALGKPKNPLANTLLPYCFALCHWSKKCKSAVYEKENGQEGGYCYQFEKDEEQLDSIEGNQVQKLAFGGWRGIVL